MEGTRLIWLLTLFAASALSGKVPVQDECAQGPEFWCQDLMTAVQCGAVDHCKQTAWLETDVLCVQCKQIVNILLDMVKASPIQDTIKKFLHKQCAHLPVVPLIAQCNLLVDQYETMMVNVLEKQVNPDALCSTLKLCHSDQAEFWNNEFLPEMILEKIFPLIQEHWHNAHVKATQGQRESGDLPIPKPMCWMCKTFLGRLEAVIPKAAIAKAASQLCLALPAKVAGVCQCLVEKYTVILLDIVLEKLGPQLLCKLLLMCATDENCEADLPVIPVLDVDFTCDTCLAVTSLIKPTISQNMTQAEVEAAVMKAHTEPGMAWKEIQTFLKNHHTELSLLLHKQWDQRKTCQALGACPAPAAPQNSGCAVGPSYWCQNQETAKECGAVSHCLTHVWL
ncbi:pulmonary surfactant-associated protein B [Xenopus laevis]|uniref:Pulmonary surfactant-associated protein B n=2 Tax=Xenopus laevis TaxID=8355 RepID=A0A974D7H7_XENLA|nr:pulmonary surfactant-associated protein B [Xenopus laevis]OCT86608.1 hypothetical protein XELAEV_18020289mg [Xenopus laevis]